MNVHVLTKYKPFHANMSKNNIFIHYCTLFVSFVVLHNVVWTSWNKKKKEHNGTWTISVKICYANEIYIWNYLIIHPHEINNHKFLIQDNFLDKNIHINT